MAKRAQPATCLICRQPVAKDQLVVIPYAGLAELHAVHPKCLDAAILSHERFRVEVAGLLLRIHDLQAELAARDDGHLHRLIERMREALAPKLIMKGWEAPDWWGCSVCQASSLASPDAIIHRAGCVVVAEVPAHA